MTDASTWVEDVRGASSIQALYALWDAYGGASNGPEFARIFAWRKEELTRGGNAQSNYTDRAEQLFEAWDDATKQMQDHGRLWATADAQVKRTRAKKFLYWRHQGKSVTDAEAHADDDEELYQARLTRNTNEAMLKADYSVRDSLQARWEYLRTQMTSERAADLLHAKGGEG